MNRPTLYKSDLTIDGVYDAGEPYVVDDPSMTQSAFMYSTFAGSAYLGFFPIPFTAWDMSNPASPRQLNVVIRDRDQDNAWNVSGQEADTIKAALLPNGGDHRFRVSPGIFHGQH